MILLSAIIVFTGVFASWNLQPLTRDFFIWLTLLAIGVYGFFISIDMFTMVLFYETALIPMYLLIGLWGTGKKEYSAMKLTLMLMGENGIPLDEVLVAATSRGAQYLNVADKVGTLKAVHFVDGTKECIAKLTEEIRKSPIDIGLIGIGENGHIAFNDPPADFETKEAYIIVNLDERCKQQQLGEGWFSTINDVPKQAVSMTTHQIMQCERIVSCVPYAVKAEAVENTVKAKATTNMVPATLLKEHKDFILYLDEASAAGILK